MTRKDYQLIARVINKAMEDCVNFHDDDCTDAIKALTYDLAFALSLDNPRFEVNRFNAEALTLESERRALVAMINDGADA